MVINIMMVRIDKIKIPWYFTNTPPKTVNINKHIEYFDEHNDFLHPIILSKNSLRLADGYIDYLIAVQKGFSEIDCQIENIKRGKKSIHYTNSKRKRSIRKKLLNMSDGKCAYCGCSLQADNPNEKETYVTIDHVIPLSKLGFNHISNMQPLCIRCNKIKANIMPEEFEKVYSESLEMAN